MNSILTSITGTFGKRMLLASLLPVLVTFLLLSFLYGGVSVRTMGQTITALSAGDTTLILIAITIAAFTLHTLNVPILRLFEGYPWRYTVLGRHWVKRHADRFVHARKRTDALRRVQEVFPAGSSQRRTVTGVRDRIKRDLEVYPYEKDWILPTRLGNVMRRAETYSFTQYGIDSVYLWPRLVQVIEDRYNAMIEESRISMDFCVHMAFLLASSAGISVVAFFLQTGPIRFGTLWGSLLLLGLAWAMYLLSLGRAHAWGQMIKSSIDLFRWDLLEQLGVQYKPATMDDERDLWTRISQQLHHGDFVDTNLKSHPRVRYQEKAPAGLPAATAESDGDRLTVHKAYVGRSYDSIRVRLTVTNDAERHPATSVRVVDEVLPGYVYSLDSESGVAKDGVKAGPSGRVEFSISPPIPAKSSFSIEYRIIRLHT